MLVPDEENWLKSWYFLAVSDYPGGSPRQNQDKLFAPPCKISQDIVLKTLLCGIPPTCIRQILIFLFCVKVYYWFLLNRKCSIVISLNEIDKLVSVIKGVREQKSLIREDLAKKIGISPRYLLLIENEKKKPSYKILFKIIHKLSINNDGLEIPFQNRHLSYCIRRITSWRQTTVFPIAL